MVTREGYTVLSVLDGPEPLLLASADGDVWRDTADDHEPDLTAAATGGILLGMLPSELGVEVYVCDLGVDVWVRDADSGKRRCYGGPTLGEAAGRALLALWEATDAR